MHKKYSLVRDWRHLLTLAGVAVTSGLTAQTAEPADEALAGDEDVYILSPFEVTVERNAGYMAADTLAGSRIRTDLRDVATSISVVTKEMIQDIGATDNSTLLQYTTNAEVAGTRGTCSNRGNDKTVSESSALINPQTQQRVRGLASATTTRDFFVSDIPWDSFNTDRIDIQRGPNSILFGLGSPAGIINASTREAQFTDTGSVEFRFGSYGSVRGSIDVNKEIIDDVLAVRVDVLEDKEQFQQNPAYEDDERIYTSVRWEPKIFGPSFHTTVKVRYEHGDIEANRPRIVPPADAITAWFNEDEADGLVASDLYALGASASTTNPWYRSIVGNQQTPVYFIDGATGDYYQVYGGYINNGWRNTNGTVRGEGESCLGQSYSEMFYGLVTYNDYATNAKITDYLSGQWKSRSLTDSSLFNFYDTLIDGDTKREWENWDAYNLTVSQTAWNEKVGIELTYDRQKYERGGENFLGGNPILSIDITPEFQDGSTNPNFGRAFVSTNYYTGTSYESDREFLRASAYVELAASDFIDNEFLTKLIGRHRFNAVAGRETYEYENRTWRLYANANSWDIYARYKSGSTASFYERPSAAVVYLGSSLANATTGSGANIPGITGDVTLESSNIYVFDSTWTGGTNYADAWVPAATIENDPLASTGNAHYDKVYNRDSATAAALTQAANMANYKGWNSSFQLDVLKHGVDGTALYTDARIVERVTNSYVGVWQGFMWNEAIIPMLGWRFDEVTTRGDVAQADTLNKSFLNMSSEDIVNSAGTTIPGYTLDGTSESVYKGHSLAGGVVVHLNRLVPKSWDVLPFNVSLSYNESNCFEVSSARVDLYGNGIDNPKGETVEYGIALSTKDNRFIFRATQYETNTMNAYVSSESGFAGVLASGLSFRNVFLYTMTGYNYATTRVAADADPGTGGTRWFWFPAYCDANGLAVASYANGQSTTVAYSYAETAAQAAQHRDACITAWNNIQKFLTERGFFDNNLWGFTPQSVDCLTDRATFAATLDANNNPAAQYVPELSTVAAAYSAKAPNGYAITGNSSSEGYEFEFTANPTKNWRISFNAAKTTAIFAEVGGAQYDELISYLDEQMAGMAGEMRRWNGEYTSNIIRNAYNTWRGTWTLIKLKEDAALSELRKWRFNVVTNYNFTEGMFKGVNVGAAYRWQDDVILGYPVALDANGRYTFDIENPYMGPAEDGLDFWVGYERELNDDVTWKIQLNVRNAFKDNDLIPISVQPDGTWASVRTAPVQEWFLTNTFTF
jgi:outer membrane receptor protein involved in Fe transport